MRQGSQTPQAKIDIRGIKIKKKLTFFHATFFIRLRTEKLEGEIF